MSSCRQNIATCQTTASEGSLYISDHFTFTVLPPALPCPPNSLIQCLLVAGCPIVARVNSLFSCQLKHMLNHYDPNFRKIEAQSFAISQDPHFFPMNNCRSQVGVFMDQPLEEVSATALAVELDVVQLHGAEDAKFVEELQKLLPEAGKCHGDFYPLVI